MRIVISTLATAAVFLAASAAGAVTFTVIDVTAADGSPLNALQLGEEFTIDVRVSADADEVFGLGASVFGYDESVADFVYGEAVESIFHSAAIPGVGALGGILNLSAGPLVESSIGANGNRVQIFSGVTGSAATAQPLDPGLDGIVGGGDAQFRLTFQMVGVGWTALTIGTGYVSDGVITSGGQILQANNAVVEVTIVPEPGTGLLVGFGLAGLALTYRER